MTSKVIITMQPDSCCSLFWWEDGTCRGDSESLTLFEDGDSIEIKIPGLENWLNEYMWQCLVPYETGKITLEELNKTFDWKSFHDKGLMFAKEIKKMLPENIELIYKSPYEDISGSIENRELKIE